MKPGGIKEEVQKLQEVMDEFLATGRVKGKSSAFRRGGVVLPSPVDAFDKRVEPEPVQNLESSPEASQTGGGDAMEAAELLRRAIARLKELG